MKITGIEDVTSCNVVEETAASIFRVLRRAGVSLASAVINTKRQQTEWQCTRTYTVNIVAPALNHRSYGNATVCSLCIDDLHVADSNTHLFSVAIVIKQWFAFAFLLSYEIFHTAVKSTNVLSYPCIVPDILSDCKLILEFLDKVL